MLAPIIRAHVYMLFAAWALRVFVPLPIVKHMAGAMERINLAFIMLYISLLLGVETMTGKVDEF